MWRVGTVLFEEKIYSPKNRIIINGGSDGSHGFFGSEYSLLPSVDRETCEEESDSQR